MIFTAVHLFRIPRIFFVLTSASTRLRKLGVFCVLMTGARLQLHVRVPRGAAFPAREPADVHGTGTRGAGGGLPLTLPEVTCMMFTF